jgi:hypothetical protein
MTIQFSRNLAIIGGILAPLLETVRRWHTWQESPPNLFDDYIMVLFCFSELGKSAKTFITVKDIYRQLGLLRVG